jgi:hypothetical protein
VKFVLFTALLLACGAPAPTPVAIAAPVALPAPNLAVIEDVPEPGDVEAVTFVEGGALVVHRDRVVRRYDPSGTLTAARRTRSGAHMTRVDGGIVVATADAFALYDAALAPQAACSLPAPWRPSTLRIVTPGLRRLVSHAGAFGIFDPRACNVTPLAPAFATIARDDVLISENGAFAGIDDAACDTMLVHHLPDMRVHARDRGARDVRGAKGCHALEISNAGAVRWQPWGMCAVANYLADGYFDVDHVAVKMADSALVFVSGVTSYFDCGGMSDAEDPPVTGRVSLAAFRLENARIALQAPRSLAVWDEHTVVRVALPTFATARPSIVDR